MHRYVKRNPDRPGFPRPEGMPDGLYRLLVGRGIDSAEAAEAFLDPGLKSLEDPLTLNDMGEAVAHIRAAMEGGWPICVYGDYDVDGVSGSAILSEWLKSQGADARVYLPSRHSEGYGLNEDAIRKIALWAKLLVTVDCGITSVEHVALAKRLGLDVVVTDHHEPAEILPDCPVVNPLLGGYPFPYLCGAGVAWKLVWALGGREAAMPWVDVAALATVADVVQLTGENRAIVRLGLEAMNRDPRVGIAALIEVAGLKDNRVTSTTIGFQLGPRLNAGGRLGSAERSLDLIRATDPAQARKLAEALDAENTRRKEVQEQILREAEAQLEGFDFAKHRALILAGKGWNPGVVGLAASKLVEKYHYPAVVLADQGDKLTGSCRTIDGVDIHAALCGCAHTLEKFGGHKKAAGLTLLPDRLEAFRTAMDDWLWVNIPPETYVPACVYDEELSFHEITTGLVAALEGMQPTGEGNPAPLFRASAEVMEARPVGADGAHLKLTLAQDGRRLGGIAFGKGTVAHAFSGGLDALFTLKLNDWQGRVEPELMVKELANADISRHLGAKLPEEPALQCGFLTEIFYNKKIHPASGDAEDTSIEALAEWLRRRPQGTLVVTADIAGARRLLQLSEGCPPDLYLGELPSDPRAFNAVCVCPASGCVPTSYERLVLFGVPEEAAPGADGAKLYHVAADSTLARALPDIDALRQAYRVLNDVAKRPAWCRSLTQLAEMAAREAGMGDVAVAASILAMADMGLFELDLSARPIALARCRMAKADPGASRVWNLIQRWRAEA